MRFVVRPGADPVAKADGVLLKALGLPFGGVLKVGSTHVLVQGGSVDGTSLLLGPLAMKNAGVEAGQGVDATRAVLATAHLVEIGADRLPVEPKVLVRAWQGRPVTSGDTLQLEPSHAGTTEALTVTIKRVEPDGAGLVGAATRFIGGGDPEEAAAAAPEGAGVSPAPTTGEALLAGLDAELDLLTGWLALLTSSADLPAAWGLPRVAGVLLEGPHGCGKSELVNAAAAAAGATVHEVAVDRVFKPERLLDLLDGAVKTAVPPGVIFVDRLEVVAGEEGLTTLRTQAGAILRWFLDAVAEKPGIACVLGVGNRANLDRGLLDSPLLPRSLAVPPPDLNRRRLLFEAALARVPAGDLDFDQLAARSAGFSGADIVAAVIHASSQLARRGGRLTTAIVTAAVEETIPSLGSLPMGEMPSYGFDKVADLEEVKQRLIESVVWPVTDPDRFRAMGIDPPRGILLYGPPGTGKTFVIRALAHEAGAAFFPIKGAELLDKYVGESERGVREVFSRARAAAPSILFFDEIDALAPVRGRSTNNVTDSVVAALLTEMDGITSRGEVAVIGATNRRDLIDPALLRAGRFEIQIELGLPDVTARRALLDLSDVPFAPDVDLQKVAEITEGMSMADLAGTLREAALAALRQDRSARQVNIEHLLGAIERWRAAN
jgi:transitional endoplasmic reticulum ATPase